MLELRVRDDSGDAARPYRYSARTGDYQIELLDKAAGSASTRVSHGAGADRVSLGFTLDGAVGPPTLAGAVLSVPVGAATVRWTATARLLKEDVVLAQRPSGDRLTFRVQQSGLRFAPDGEGGYHALDAAGTARFRVLPATVEDATGRPGAATLTLDSTSAIVALDPAFLASAIYPITVDPSISFSQTGPLGVGWIFAETACLGSRFGVESPPGLRAAVNEKEGNTTGLIYDNYPVKTSLDYRQYDGYTVQTTDQLVFWIECPDAEVAGGLRRYLSTEVVAGVEVARVTPVEGMRDVWIMRWEDHPDIPRDQDWNDLVVIIGNARVQDEPIPVDTDGGVQQAAAVTTDPINTFTGAFQYSRTDVAIPGFAGGLGFSRSYNSGDTRVSQLGPGWTYGPEMRLVNDPYDGRDDLVLAGPGGRRDRYARNPDGSFTPPRGIQTTLRRNGDGTYTATHPDQSSWTFDGFGRLAGVADAQGNQLTLRYSNQGQLEHIIDPARRGNLPLADPDRRGVLALVYGPVTHPDGATCPAGRLCEVRDWASPPRVVRYGYDAQGRLSSASDREGKVTRYSYDGTSQRLAAIADARGNVAVSNRYDAQGRVQYQWDASVLAPDPATLESNARVTKLAYGTPDASGARTTVVTYPATSFEPGWRFVQEDTHNAGGQLVRRVSKPTSASAEWATEELTYDAIGNRASTRDARGAMTYYCYDAGYNGVPIAGSRGNLTRLVQPPPSGTTGPLITLYRYNAQNAPVQVVPPKGVASEGVAWGQTRDAYCGLDFSASASSVYATNLAYDASGTNLVSATRGFTDPELGLQTATTTFTYGDPAYPGLVTKAVPPRGNDPMAPRPAGCTAAAVGDCYATTFAYYPRGDARAGLLQRVTTPARTGQAQGDSTTYDYDAVGRRVSTTDPTGGTWSAAYDNEDRVTSTTAPAPAVGQPPLVTRAVYDAVGNKTVAIDANGQVTQSVYDERDSLQELVEAPDPWTWPDLAQPLPAPPASAITTRYAYDALGNLAQVKRAAGTPDERVVDYTYDGANRVRTETQQTGVPAEPTLVTRTTYDLNGNRQTLTDPKNQTTTFSYDALNRLTRVDYSDPGTPDVAYTYDAHANRATMQDGTGTTTYTYDEQDRLLSVTSPGTPAPSVVGSRYDLDGNRRQLLYPDGTAVSYRFDPGSRMEALTDWANRTTRYGYEPDGRLQTASFPNDTGASYTYDAARRLTRVRNQQGPTGSNVISQHSYTLDAVGNRTRVDEVLPRLGAPGPETAGGAVLAWGRNAEGQLGNGVMTRFPGQERRLAGLTQVAAGTDHGLALRGTDGAVFAWGRNDAGQLGDGTADDRAQPVAVAGLGTGTTSLAGGGQHSLALKADGSVWGWGRNSEGQLADGTRDNRGTAAPVASGAGVTPGVAGALAGDADTAMAFDGQRGYLESSGALSVGGSYTLEAWVKPVAGAPQGFVLSLGGADNLELVVDGPSTSFRGMTSLWGDWPDYSVSTGPITPWDAWHHVVFTVDSNRQALALYVDGVPRASRTLSGTAHGAPYTDGRLTVGWSAGDWVGKFQGSVDEVALYPTALSAARVQAHYAAGQGAAGAGPYPDAVRADRPDAYYRLGGTSNRLAADGSGAGGSVGGVTRAVPGALAGDADAAMAFDGGTGFVSVPDAPILDSGDVFGAELWVKRTRLGVTEVLLGKGPGSYALGFASDNTVFLNQNQGGTIATSTVAISDTTVWHHLAWTKNGADARIYVDGVDRTSPTVGPQVLRDTGEPLHLGADSFGGGGAGFYAAAALDEVAVYRHPLRAERVRAHYEAGTGVVGAGPYADAVLADGPVGYWRLGDAAGASTAADRSTGARPLASGLGAATGLSATHHSSAALQADGTVWAWGDNGNLELGDGTRRSRQTPGRVGGATPLTDIVAVASGYHHALALRRDGTVWAWGTNGYGQLGDGTTTDRALPVQVQDPSGTGVLTGITAIATGGDHSLARKADGTLLAWGYGRWGQLGDGASVHRALPVGVQDASGTGALAGVTEVAGAGHQSYARTADGTTWAWGGNWHGQLGDGTTWNQARPVVVKDASGAGLSGVVGLAVGAAEWMLVRRSDGTAWAWGVNRFGQRGDGTTTSTPSGVAGLDGATVARAGGRHSVTLQGDGTLRAWGANGSGQLGDGTTTDRATPVVVRGPGGTGTLDRVVAVSASDRHTLALRDDATVWAWGGNDDGQLGDGTLTNRASPVPVPGLPPIRAIAAGEGHSLALAADGRVWAWGEDHDGELGRGTAGATRPTPDLVPGLANIVSLAAGEDHSLAVGADGTVWAWGQASSGELGDGTTGDPACGCRATPARVQDAAGTGVLDQVVGVSAGWAHSLALRQDGTAWGWGANASGQLGDGTQTQRLRPVRVDGGLGGGVTAEVPGALPNDPDPALRLDGVRSGLVGVKPVRVGADGAFSLEVWAKPASTADTGFVLSVDAGDQRARQIRFDGARGTFAGVADVGGTWGLYAVDSTAGPVDRGQWHHVVFTSALRPDGSGLELVLYVDGVQVGTRTVPRTEGFTAVPVLGWANAPWLQRFQGEVDEAALYGQALSLAQVQAHYAARTGTAGSYAQAVRADGPLASWRLGEAADARTGLVEARDSTGNGHTLLSGLGGLREVGAGGWHSLGQRSDGTSWSWGEGDGEGRLGEPLPWNRAEPRPIPRLTGMQTLSGGTEHSLALLPGRSSTTTYAYDRLQRLTGVTAPAPQGSTTYSYDRVGNRVNRTRRGLSTTSAYDRADRITATQELGALSTAYTLDANGNTVQRGAETFGYDQANRLRSSTLGAVSYAYNGDGVRVSTTVGALTTRFVSDVNGSLPVVLTETGPTGTRKYVYGAGGLAYVDEGLVTGIRVYHTDGLGSARALTDSRGWVVQTYQTDEFGVPESLSSLGASTQPRQYTGEPRDSETGFVYLRARMYDPQLGRFIQADPLRQSGPGVGGWNRYTYVGNNPVRWTDPSGTDLLGTLIHGPIQNRFKQLHPTFEREVIHRLGNAPSGSLLGSIRVDLEEVYPEPTGVFYEIKPAWQERAGVRQVEQRVAFAEANGFDLIPGPVLPNEYWIPIFSEEFGLFIYARHAAPGLITYTYACPLCEVPSVQPFTLPVPFPGRLPSWFPRSTAEGVQTMASVSARGAPPVRQPSKAQVLR